MKFTGIEVAALATLLDPIVGLLVSSKEILETDRNDAEVVSEAMRRALTPQSRVQADGHLVHLWLVQISPVRVASLLRQGVAELGPEVRIFTGLDEAALEELIARFDATGAASDLDPMRDQVVRLADEIAAHAHDGQTDKAGRPYIEHPRRVAAALSAPACKAAALLHDVVEDCPGWTIDRLTALGVPAQVCEAVDSLTKRDRESVEDYLWRVAENEIATSVKMCDMADNADPSRLAELDRATATRLEQKYINARQLLLVFVEERSPAGGA